jgi:hypothetical protein
MPLTPESGTSNNSDTGSSWVKTFTAGEGISPNAEQRVADLLNFSNRHGERFSPHAGDMARIASAKLDYGLIRRNPKILVGYSDITALACDFYKIASPPFPVRYRAPATFTPEKCSACSLRPRPPELSGEQTIPLI